jgi:phage tail-like protein
MSVWTPQVPFMAFQFSVALGSRGNVVGGFSDVTGLASEVDVETLRAGGVNDAELTLPGAAKFPTRLVLKGGIAQRATLWNWYVKIMTGTIERQNVTITMKSADKREQLQWTFKEACPVKWTGPELHAATSGVAFESIDLVHKGFLL